MAFRPESFDINESGRNNFFSKKRSLIIIIKKIYNVIRLFNTFSHRYVQNGSFDLILDNAVSIGD